MKKITLVTIMTTIFVVIVAIAINLIVLFIPTLGALSPISAGLGVPVTILALVLSSLQLFYSLQTRHTRLIKKSDKGPLESVSEIEFLPKNNPTSEVVLKEQIKGEVKDVVKEVEKAQDSAIDQPGLEISEDVLSDINEILHASSVNPRAALLLLSAKIERQMRLRLQEAGLQQDTDYVSSRRATDLAMKANLFPEDTISAFQDFFTVRNRVAHSAAFDVDESTILTLVSIGIELLKLVATKKLQDTEASTIDANRGE